ncbi:MAG: N utilization substance protein B [Caulobacter vibrioides]|jgi:N utilization substance protein B|uniref:Transcription antitermination protein NusB n=1 Tax=Caulobacter vibrioides TaxID=155892 RepID=A0A258D997_CAUVI|nr:MAG: N utilization substance protein B [Caulobacter vibrioides]
MSGARIQPRSVARLAAVQALYQMEVSGAGVDSVIREFGEHRFDRDVEGEQLAAADETFFADLAKGVVANQNKIDQGIVKRLASGWRLERLDATARAVLRAGAFELMYRPDVPTEVVINEYVEIAKSFFEGPESGFINGALDAIARDARD